MTSTLLAPAFEVALGGKRLEPDVAATLSSLNVVHQANSLDQFTLTLSNPFPELPYTHGAHRSLFAAGTGVAIKLGYVDALETVFDGEVTAVSVDFGEQGSTVSVQGHSRLRRLLSTMKTRTFYNATDSEIAGTIARDADLRSRVDLTETKHPCVSQANQTDLDFLRDRALGIGFELFADGETLVFRRRRDGGTAALTLVWGDEQRAFADRRSRPLLRFAPTVDAAAPVTKVTVRGLDPRTRQSIVGVASPGDETDKSGTSGAAVVEQAFGRPRELVVVDRPVESPEEADTVAKALFNERQRRLVRGSGSTIGTPALRAGSVVALAGIGEVFSGAYTVAQSTHRLDGSGYSTSFEVERGAIG
jgi:phage protein D